MSNVGDMATDVGALGWLTRKRVVALLRNYGIVLGTVLLAVVLASASSQFLTLGNAQNVLDQWAATGIMAAGMTIVLIGGGFDLSAGSSFALAGIVAAEVAQAGYAVPALAAGVLAGVVAGAVNGMLVTAVRINPFVATLSTGFIIGGIALAITEGLLISVDDPAFGALGQNTWLGFTWGTYLMLAVMLVSGFVLHRTVLGRRIYAVGGNPEAARLSGLRVERIRAFTYILMGALTGLAGVLQASRVATGEANAGGLSLLFNVFAIVIVGGTSLHGGEGAMWRTAIGLLILAMIGNAFALLNLTAVYQQIFFGGILLLAVALDAHARGRSSGVFR